MNLTLLIIGRKRLKYFSNLDLDNTSGPAIFNVIEGYWSGDGCSSKYLLSTNQKEELMVWLDCMGLKIGGIKGAAHNYIGELGTYREYELTAK